MLVETFQRGQRHLPRLLPLRRTHQPRHPVPASRPAAGAGGKATSRLRGQRLCAGHLGAQTQWATSTSNELFQEDMLGDDLDAWLDESFLMKRAFPALRHAVGPDPAPPSGVAEDRAAGDLLHRPDLRRPAQAISPTICCCVVRGRMRRPARSTWRGSVASCKGSREDSNRWRWSASPPSPCRCCSKSGENASPGVEPRRSCRKLPTN